MRGKNRRLRQQEGAHWARGRRAGVGRRSTYKEGCGEETEGR